MPRPPNALHIIREYRLDQDRCLRAIVALLRWEPPEEGTTAPTEDQATTDSAPEEEHA